MLPTLSIKQAKDLFFDRAPIMKAIDAGRRKALSKAGAIVMRRARGIIKEGRKFARRPKGQQKSLARRVIGRKQSVAGNPPLSWTGLLRDNIFFSYDEKSSSVVVGPASLNKSTDAPHVLEFGGKWRSVKRKRGVKTSRSAVFVKPHPYMAPALIKALPKIPEQFRGAVVRGGG